MRAATASLLLTLYVASHARGIPPAASDDPPARFTVTTRKADDTVAVGGDRERTTLDVKSPSGISRAVVERTGDAWPKAVVVRLHLKGLENLKVSAGAVAVGAAAGVRDGKVEARQWVPDKDETPLAPADPRRLAIRVLGKDGKTAAGVPLDGGQFEVTLPAAFLRDNPKSLLIEWIDFYR
ncbi:hypothetical protein [Urbifossiella limnaea]|uniref:Uncharacterized protein n=1 Tax=Urbifossiella limnaea TaxID=2528023 RepID=A0A517XU59_9BACT|nr:hypothetical protein [Urbifossiella limnaea]QDU20994.1 hypothetical protein ETAA1_29570 [Urbifossiella limnaea]